MIGQKKGDSTEMNFRLRLVAAIAIVVGISLLCAALYAATTAEILLAGTISDSRVFNGPVNVSTRMLTLKPGDKLPWHYHPGYAFNVVKSGTLTVEDGCGGRKTLSAGEGFEAADGRVHRGANLSDRDTIVYDNFIIPQGKPTTVTFPGEESRCGPPQATDECKNGGWRKFDHPRRFDSQGQCLSFVRRLQATRVNFQPFPLN
jgi:quercetin dioxygenase-like cupin family protein